MCDVHGGDEVGEAVGGWRIWESFDVEDQLLDLEVLVHLIHLLDIVFDLFVRQNLHLTEPLVFLVLAGELSVFVLLGVQLLPICSFSVGSVLRLFSLFLISW